ncbi:MAG: leucine-rich repeat domain-containing protein [Prevotellaceae bacterium]|nr:leucine-rich repeat domain-containing protein [Prevotellaceae bacterium]
MKNSTFTNQVRAHLAVLFKSVMILMMLATVVPSMAAVGDTIFIGQVKYIVLSEDLQAKPMTGTVSASRAYNTDKMQGKLEILHNFGRRSNNSQNGIIIYTVTSIDDYAFGGCENLSSVSIPSSVVTIGNDAFGGCKGLTGSLIIPDNVTSIGWNAFGGCAGLTSLTLGEGLKTIDYLAFSGCAGLTSVSIPNHVTSIGVSAFNGCTGLTSLTLGNSVTTIGNSAFSGCTGLTGTLTIPNSVTSIGASAFENCSSLTSLMIPTMIKFTGDVGFIVKPSLTSIGNSAFSGCKGLTGTLVIPDSVTTIGNSAFSDCTNLTSVTLGSRVKTIGDYAFSSCKGFISLTIGNSVTTIGKFAFAFCKGLTSLTIGNHVTSIGVSAFNGCTGLTGTLTIPNSVTTIGNTAFSAAHLTSVLIPNSVTTLGVGNFTGFTNTSLYVSYPSHLQNFIGAGKRGTTRIVTVPYESCNENLGTMINSTIYYMGTNLWNSGNFTKSTPYLHTYVKPSVYEACKDSAKYASLLLTDKIPVTFPTGKKYITMCRDFDVDLSHANDNLPAGIEPLKAYVVDKMDDDMESIYMSEIKYIPSRLKANVENYKGVDEYVGVVLKGTPGYTYYVQMGENDYSKGADGQTTIAMALSGSKSTNNAAKANATESTTPHAYLVGAAYPMDVKPEETVDGVTYKTYGLKDNEFKEYESEGVIPYNKAYLRVPVSTTTGSAKPALTIAFRDDDGTTSIEHVSMEKSDDNATYNMQGMKVGASYHGLVIRGGKKFIQ